MGGKQNRTKNNVRPSNSGRSAAMLYSNLPQFSGFTGTSKPVGLSSFAFSNPIEDFDTSLDDNFQLVLKKVSKKDSTTKLKGLQEFAEMVQNADLSVIKALLPSWPRFYSILVIHPDNRIREATQNAHQIIVLKAKREIAPYLKQLMAPWYTSQYDNYPPAAAAAIQAFKDTFSPTKFKEAVIFCHQEILSYIYDNLIVQTAETASPSQFSPEEAETRYERIVISCLQGYAVYLKEVPEENLTQCLDLNSEIVSNKKFWKLSQSKVSLIRSSWFQVLSVILQKEQRLLKGKESLVFTTILNSLKEEEEALVLPGIWECLLLATSSPDWHKYINLDQQFLPKILNEVKQGGRNNATLVYPNLLPLLSNLPLMEDKKKKQFYSSFFENMNASLKNKTVIISHQETKAVALAYMECLQFLVLKNLDNTVLCKCLFKQLSNLLEWCLMKEAVCYRVIFIQFSQFLTLVTRHENNVIGQLVKDLCNSLCEIFSNNTMVFKQIELLLELKSIKLECVQDLVLKTFEIYVKRIQDSSSNDLFKSLVLLVKEFGNETFLKLLPQNEKSEAMDIYRTWFKNWLFSDQMYCESILDLIFLLMEDLSLEDKEEILRDLLKIKQDSCLVWSILRALSMPQDPAIVNFLNKDAVKDLFKVITEEFIANKCSEEHEEMLKIVFSNKGFMLDAKLLEEIINKVVKRISKDIEENTRTDAVYSLAMLISKSIYLSSKRLTCGDQLLMALFNLVVKNNEKTDIWRESLERLLENIDNSEQNLLIQRHFEFIKEEFQCIVVNKRRAQMENLHEVIEILLESVDNKLEDLDWLMESISINSQINLDSLLDLCKMAEYVKGTLDSPYEEILIKKPIGEQEVLNCFTYNYLKIKILATKINNNIVVNLSEDLTETVLDIIYSYTILQTFLKHFNNIKHYNELVHHLNQLEDSYKGIIDSVNVDFEKLLKSYSLKFGWIWSIAAFNLKINCDNISETNESIGSLHTKQTYGMQDRSLKQLIEDAEKLRSENLTQFLYENCDMSWQDANKLIRVVKDCKILIENFTLDMKYWDFIVVTIFSWIMNCVKARKLLKQYQYQAMVVSVTDLYIAIRNKVAKLKEENKDIQVNCVQEWEDVIEENVHANIAQLWLFLADHFTKNQEDPFLNLPFLQSFGKITEYLRHDLLFKTAQVPKWSKFLKISTNSLLTNCQTILQIWGYKMLSILSPGLVKLDEESVNNTLPHKNGLIFEQFKNKLSEIQDVVNSILSGFRVGENSCKVEPGYDSFTYSLAYLFLWDVMISLSRVASSELRFQYSDWLKESALLSHFLSNLFKLMPFTVLRCDNPKLKVFEDIFLKNPLNSDSYSIISDSETIEHLACYLYKSSLEQFATLVRQWWSVLDIKTSQIVEKVTTSYVSSCICLMEFNNVIQNQNAYKNLKIKVMPSIREIQAVYTVDEAQMELTITLPLNYPLGSPDIVCNRQISGASQKQWLLQFKKCVLHQNGKIWDGLSIWNANLDRKFDGVEECYICYAVLHSGTYQMPKLSCRTCKKKFHSVCLYKWFSSSNKSSCPICRNLF